MAQSQVGKIYVGANQMFPGIQTFPQIPTSGLIGWYDAADYTSGATWTDKSGNGLNLTLGGTFSKTGSIPSATGPAVFFNTGFGLSATTSLITGSTGTSYTHIEIIRPSSVSFFVGSYCFSANNPGDDFGSLSGFQITGTGIVTCHLNNQPGAVQDQSYFYATNKTSFIARRFSYGSSAAAVKFNVADSAGTTLTQQTGTGINSFTSLNYTFGVAGKMVVGASSNGGGYRQPGYYGVNLFYNRVLTDQEVTNIYNYYKSTYSLS